MNLRKINELMWELTEPGASFTVRASFYSSGVAVYEPGCHVEHSRFIIDGNLLDAAAVAQTWWHPLP